MIAKLIGMNGYRYTKDGERKEGVILTLSNPEYEQEQKDDGNWRIGYETDRVALPINLRTNKQLVDNLKANIGRNIDLVYERRFGSKFERLADVKVKEV